MTNKMLSKKVLYSALLALCIQMQIYADTIWSGGTQSADVTIAPGNSLDISNTNFLSNPINITNSGGSANVNIVASAIVTSSQPLYFHVPAGSTTNVNITSDLLLTGSNGAFLITLDGGGTLQFNVTGGHVVSLSSTTTLADPAGDCIVGNISPGGCGNSTAAPATDLTTTSTLNNGAILLVDMTDGNMSTITFQPATTTLTDNAVVEVGANSAISFLGDGPSNSGTINFDASIATASAGRLILQIDNGGSVLNQAAHLINTPVTLENIQFNQGDGFGSPAINFIKNNFPAGYSGLMIVNGNTTWTGLENNPFCELIPTTSNVIKKGFILAAGSELTVADGSYIDYVVTVTNVTVYADIPDNVLNQPCQRFLTRVIKDRNPAALIIDGNPDNSNPAVITMDGNSAIYFRSGVDCRGNSCLYSFTINPAADLKNEGTILLEVEGPLIVNGDSSTDDATQGTIFQILSWQVAPTGGSVLINQIDTTFPLRTFAQDANGNYLQYGSGNFFINNKMQYVRMHLQHMDENHAVYEDNVAGDSSPSYIGGDRLNICCSSNLNCPCYAARVTPALQFYNSFFDLHTSAAVTGLSLQVVNDAGEFTTGDDNTTQFVFYGNGRCIDNGTGRSLVFGTEVGSQASDFQTIVSRSAHLDIMQTNSLSNTLIDLALTVSYNNFKVTPNIVGDINGQLGINTLFLAYASNISVGSQDAQFAGTSIPTLNIFGEFFSFMTQGGDLKSPETSSTTGQGGMFVDKNGFVDVGINRANFGMMVTKSLNGRVNLPINQVFFDPRVGIAQWQLNLNDPSQLIIINSSDNFSDYTIDWKNLMKDYCSTFSQALFVPYEPTTAPFFPATLYPVIPANLNGLPTIQGQVEQLQVKNSRLGDQVHLLVDGGLVREFVFLTGSASATAPVGVLVLQNNALVGIGTASRNVDSLDASVVLGINGVTLMPNGNATVRLNVDTLINNYCHIVTGTNFGTTPVTGDRLLIDSVVPKELRIKSDGVLDLTQFTATTQTLVIAGAVNLVLEPGAEVVLGGGNLIFAGDAVCYCEPNTSVNLPAGTSVLSTDSTRVKFSGAGRVTFKENAQLFIPRGALVGVETNLDFNVPRTTQSWAFTDDAQMTIGSDTEYGGGFQVGDTDARLSGPVNFSLLFTGVGATLNLNSQGFFGAGVGIVNKPQSAPNTWLVGQLFNVATFNLNFTQGTFKNQQTYSGDNNLAGLLALSNDPAILYSFSFDKVNADILGGGNMVLLAASPSSSAVQPLVLSTAGTTNTNITADIMSSKAALLDYPKDIQRPLVNVTGSDLFNNLGMSEYTTQFGKTATIFRNSLGQATIGFVLGNVIRRDVAGPIRGLNRVNVNPNNSLAIGAVGIAVDLSTASGAAELSQLNPEQ